MASCTSIAEVEGRSQHSSVHWERLYHAPDFIPLACKACSPLIPLSVPLACIQGVLGLMLPEHIMKCLVCHKLGLFNGNLVSPPHPRMFCLSALLPQLMVVDLVRSTLALCMTAELA